MSSNNTDYMLTTCYLIGCLEYNVKYNLPLTPEQINSLLEKTKEMLMNQNLDVCIEELQK
jgi:hypothetical protein